MPRKRDFGPVAEQHIDDRERGLGVDVAAGEVQVPEGLVRELEADAAMHRGQRRLRRRDVQLIGIDLFGTDGEQPDGPASRADDRGVVG